MDTDDYFPADIITQAPLIPKEDALKILREVFGIQSADISLLSGYDDLNFLLENVVYTQEENAMKYGRKLVCKFTNPIEARFPELIEAQINLVEYLNSAGIPCPLPIPSIKHNKFEYVQITNDACLPLRLFTFLPGLKTECIGYSADLCSTIDDRWFRKHRIPIVLECWDYLQREFSTQKKLGTINSEDAGLCERVFHAFSTNVIQNREKFEHGIIHSDVNETNVLLEKSGNTYKVTGLLDWGDAHYSLRIFDIAASLLYIIMDVRTEDYQTEWPIIAEKFLDGYKSERSVKDLEVCQLSMCARLLASLIYGLRTVRLNARGDDPSYILKTQGKGWSYLKILFDDNLHLFKFNA